jgi:hypothetical protein
VAEQHAGDAATSPGRVLAEIGHGGGVFARGPCRVGR